MVRTKPTRIDGPWYQGAVLDNHILSSEFVGYNEFNHPQYNTVRTELGELIYRLKYNQDRSVLQSIIETAGNFILKWNPAITCIVPVPPSRQRIYQPLLDEEMTKVFVGGSRKITRLSDQVTERLENIIQKNFSILVGDANGADKSVQSFLYAKNYQNVIVFCSGDTCRNNIGGWTTVNVSVERNKRGFDFYVVKDRKMAKEASYGFMIWDLQSRGTLNNIFNLVNENKKVLVYVSKSNTFHKIKSIGDINSLLDQCETEDREKFRAAFLPEAAAPQAQLPLEESNALTLGMNGSNS